jgi:hypothetical protein
MHLPNAVPCSDGLGVAEEGVLVARREYIAL